MKFKFYIDPETQAPHIYNHDVTEQEIINLFNDNIFSLQHTISKIKKQLV